LELWSYGYNNFNGFNILQQDISRVGGIDLGFYNKQFSRDYSKKIKDYVEKNKPVVFLLNLDEIDQRILKDSFIVYLGHHGDRSAQFADIILPVPAYTEKSSTYLNMEGRVLQTTKCYLPLGEAKEEWKVFRALSDGLNNQLKFNNILELRNDIVNKYPFIKEINTLPNELDLNFSSSNKIKSRVINYNISNFYMTDSISRSSINMSNCTKEILNKVA